MSEIQLPERFELEFVGKDEGTQTGKVRKINQRYYVDLDQGFSYLQGGEGNNNVRVAKTYIDGRPTIVRGYSGGDTFQPTEIRIGSHLFNQEYTSVRAEFELFQSLSTLRYEDGSVRDSATAIIVPETGSARSMQLLLGDDGSAEFCCATPAPIEEYVQHIAALQDMIVFCADRPAACLKLIGLMESGEKIEIHGWSRYDSFGSKSRNNIEYLMRFQAAYINDVVNIWWRLRDEFRPVTQILAGLIYNPGFVESSIIAVAAALEHFTKMKFPPPLSKPRLLPEEFQIIDETLTGLKPELNNRQIAFINDIRNDSKRTRYEEYVEAILKSFSSEVLQKTKINLDNWMDALFAARNDIAHEGAPNPNNSKLFVNDLEARALRDATRVIMSLAVLSHLEVPDEVLSRAADRLGNRYYVRHTATKIYAV